MMPSLEMIATAVVIVTGVPWRRIAGPFRESADVRARGVFCYVAHEHALFSYPEISMHLGLSTHSTARTATARVRGSLDEPIGVNGLTLRQLVDQVRASFSVEAA